METALAVVESGEIVQRESQQQSLAWWSPEQVKLRINHIQHIYRDLMKKDTHFGTVPGAKKDSLWKAGSEILLSTFRISIDPVVEDLSRDGEFRFRVKCMAYDSRGEFLGAGVGECSSEESKYKWRRAVCEEEFAQYQQMGEEMARIKWVKPQNGKPYSILQVRQDQADVANTVLKMAKKRAQIDVTLTVTACSDIFTQDLDEDAEEQAAAHAQEALGEPKRTSQNGQQVSTESRKEDGSQGAGAPTPASTDPTDKAYLSEEDVDPSTLMSKCKLHGLYKGDACQKCEDERAGKIHEAVEQAKAPQAPQPAAAAPTKPSSHKISDGQAKRFYAIWNSNGITRPEVVSFLKRTWGITSDRDIPAEGYELAIEFAQGKRK